MSSKSPSRSWAERHYGRNLKVNAQPQTIECSKVNGKVRAEETLHELKSPTCKLHRAKVEQRHLNDFSKKSRRAPLSQQLQRIGAQASSITRSLRQSKSGEGMWFTLSTRSFVVGAIESKFPSPVSFYADRCEYCFYHPYEPKEIKMVMYYRDMHATRLFRAFGNAWSFQFKIQRDLLHYGTDYQYTRPDHHVSIMLNSGYDASQIRTKVLKLVKLRHNNPV